MKCKYVVVNYSVIILFPMHLSHRDVADGIGNITSAGFVGRSEETRSGFYCYGSSESLSIDSAPGDQLLLDMLFSDSLASRH